MLVFLPGCSVLEDRDICPAQLLLHLPPQEAPVLVALESASEPPSVQQDTLPPGVTDWSAFIPRKPLWIRAAVPASVYDAVSGVKIPEGSHCPEVRLYRREHTSIGEQVRDTVVFNKPYCRLEIKVVWAQNPGAYDLTVRGNVAGLDRDGQPVPGVFRYRTRPSTAGNSFINLPRQSDDSLLLDLTAGADPVRTFALGEYLAEAGYDWTAEDLSDASVTIDFARTTLAISVAGWTRVFQFQVII
ncbi:MAG: hypothetical protein J6S66_02200 [Bacteroidales bacterium]|nr:hypothetical protein [Bacteroidales bacterium]